MEDGAIDQSRHGRPIRIDYSFEKRRQMATVIEPPPLLWSGCWQKKKRARKFDFVVAVSSPNFVCVCGFVTNAGVHEVHLGQRWLFTCRSATTGCADETRTPPKTTAGRTPGNATATQRNAPETKKKTTTTTTTTTTTKKPSPAEPFVRPCQSWLGAIEFFHQEKRTERLRKHRLT